MITIKDLLNKIKWDKLIITSSPLIQFLSLRYKVPLGYKYGCLENMEFKYLSVNNCSKLLAAFVQTEGSLSYHYTRNKKKNFQDLNLL